MRFLADGPTLPDHLLTARDQGQVIFFCGAGVSRAKANLPDFYGLADLVVEDLHVATRQSGSSPSPCCEEPRTYSKRWRSPSRRPHFCFILEREVFLPDVRAAVARVLCPIAGVDLSAHRRCWTLRLNG